MRDALTSSSFIGDPAHEDSSLIEYRRKQNRRVSHIASFAANGQLFETRIDLSVLQDFFIVPNFSNTSR